MYTKEDLCASFLELRDKDKIGIGLHVFFQKQRKGLSPRELVVLLDELNKRGEIVLTARVWPAAGLQVCRKAVNHNPRVAYSRIF